MAIYKTPIGDPIELAVEVAAAGTPEPLAPPDTYILSVVLQAGQADADNVGNVTVGGADTSYATFRQVEMEPGDVFTIKAPMGHSLDLGTLFVDAENNDDGVRGFYWPSPNPS